MTKTQIAHHRPTSTTSPLNIFLLGLLGVVGLLYAVLGFLNHDLLWFWPLFDQQPAQINLYCRGNEVVIQQDSPHFQPVVNLVNQQIAADKFNTSDGLSLAAYQQLLDDPESITLEFRYATPIRIHSPLTTFSDVDTIVLPIHGPQVDQAIIYALKDGQPSSGALRLTTLQPVLLYLVENALCQENCKE